VYIAEIDLERFFEHISGKTTFKAIPKYPASVRDLSLVCSEDTASGVIVEIIEKSCKAILQSVDFFDLFRGGNLAEGSKSLSYKLTFRKADGTLTDEEVDAAVSKILGKLQQNNISLRS
jgi:phenylalanyl-tRNA synthetase beta chain